ncbi:MAG: UDP-N-acetylmuramate dehydrogenase [Sulfobacillus thermotolerans]|uniref:UDP-N-acetylenolpyruvoylglucosamine reductase n=1 Tax=Sulfobacillus thermotolerans TaxID=338644 RepID=A0ABM6RVM8_9FIRM|nr:UDP-N-acetylenolpyruvoylglucosamine reductase [Sulfobacillus thermotolerans]MCY0908317.1 UDP-N-acetylmuramate dehydrogenase [Sulfobacillus thermotolerans]
MDAERVAQELRRLDVGAVQQEEPLARHTSFRIGGPAAIYLQPPNQEALVRALDWVHREAVPYFVLGQGTNVLVSDQGLDAVVLSPSRALRYVDTKGDQLIAGAGVLLTKLAHRAHQAGLGGMEFAVSIPGTLGGALVMNAGAHGTEMKDVVRQLVVWEPGVGVRLVSSTEADFAYRSSAFMRQKWIALEAQIELTPKDPGEILSTMRHHMEYRKRTQPVGDPNAGSVFKNPPNDYAGRLIESLGAKGWRLGDAEVSQVHANFIVNRGHATAHDVLGLMRRLRHEVYARYAVQLRPEVRWIGPGEGGFEATWENLWCEAGKGLTEPCE